MDRCIALIQPRQEPWSRVDLSIDQGSLFFVSLFHHALLVRKAKAAPRGPCVKYWPGLGSPNGPRPCSQHLVSSN